MPLTTSTDRAEIDFSVYDPFTVEFARDPWATPETLLRDHPVAFRTGIDAWMVSPHELAEEVLRSPRFSTRFADWADAPPLRPEAEWNLYDRVQQVTLGNVDHAGHQRLRSLTAPAFSRRVMDRIEASIRDSIAGVFDEIPDARECDVAEDVAAKIPIRAIARMVGVPPSAGTLFEHGLGWNLVRATNPLYPAEERARYVEDALPGLQYLFDTVAERRAAGDPGDDFTGTLVRTEIDGERLADVEIVSVVVALVVAGADTAVDLHTLAVRAFLLHRDQWALLRSRPELSEAAVIEVLRWSAHGKFGGLPRFPVEDVELGGQLLEKGSFVMPLFAPAWIDPQKWPEPRRFDITRSHAGNIVFGAGPHMCIGLNLVKVQGALMLQELARRFGDDIELVGEPEYDPGHFNARRITRMTVRTGAA